MYVLVNVLLHSLHGRSCTGINIIIYAKIKDLCLDEHEYLLSSAVGLGGFKASGRNDPSGVIGLRI